MEKKNAFTITRARPEDAAALLDYLKIVGGETDNLSFGAEGVPLAPEEEQAYLRTQVDSPDHVQYLAGVDGELIGTASLNRKPGRMRHRGVFGISLKRAWWGCGAASALTEAVLAFARENGFAQLDIEVRSDNVRAIRLYEKFGFERFGVRPNAIHLKDGTRLRELLEAYDHPVLFCTGADTLNLVSSRREELARAADFLVAPQPEQT